jgi:C_GCAxxG_C_C family probable redox protein
MELSDIAEIRRTAEEAFTSGGFYCAESVVLTLAKAQGSETDLHPRMATGFCGGMARTCGPCGALSGAIMGVGLAFGRRHPGDSVEAAYEVTQKLVREFEQTFGSRNCHELLGCDLGTPEGQRRFQEDGLRDRCTEFTGKAAAIAARLIFENSVQPITAFEQLDEARQLLSASDLPVSDIDSSQALLLFGQRIDTKLVGVVGLELHGPEALLRSLAVSPSYRNRGIGKLLTAFAETQALSHGVQSLFLLTATAESFFAGLGYTVASRDHAPPAIRDTAQFSELCPSSSVFMRKDLCRS